MKNRDLKRWESKSRRSGGSVKGRGGVSGGGGAWVGTSRQRLDATNPPRVLVKLLMISWQQGHCSAKDLQKFY